MRRCRFLRWLALLVACVNGGLPGSLVLGAGPNQTVPAPTGPIRPVIDVALDASGRMTGQIVDSSGQPRDGDTVVVQRVAEDRQQRARSDREGRFVVEGLSGGVYRVVANEATTVCRCWSPGTAPPAAAPELLVVADSPVQRGQKPIGELLCSTPVLVGLLIAAAVAIPIAIHNAGEDEPAS